MEEKEFTFGEKEVGLDKPLVGQQFESTIQLLHNVADIIDQLNNFRNDKKMGDSAKTQASLAISDFIIAAVRAKTALTCID